MRTPTTRAANTPSWCAPICKGRGLGWLLMQTIIEYARAEGLETIEGQVLSENTTMLAMCRELGFDIAPDPQDPDTCIVKLETGKASIGNGP